jgi:hypothetical protein
MKRILLSLGAALGLMVLPAALEAQVPVVLVCQDGTTQPGSSRVGCGDHGGMDWEATKVWSEMRAGQYAAADTVVCTDGQNRAAGPRACADHGGVDSVSTIAAIKSRAKARRFGDHPEASERTSRQGGTVAGAEQDTASSRSPGTQADSTKWGYPANKNPEVQNPPGYRGMERAIETFPPDSTPEGDTTASASTTSRVNQLQRQDSLESGSEQNPPGYRGMERPSTPDSAKTQQTLDSAKTQQQTRTGSRTDTTATAGRDTTAIRDTSSVRDTTGSSVRDSAGMGGNDSTSSMERESQ